MHVPVLLQEVIAFLNPETDKKFIDATIGAGGHTQAILKRGGIVLGIDRDRDTSRRLQQEFRAQTKCQIVQGNFAELKTIAAANGFSEVQGVLLDLGMSSEQLDAPERGFAFQKTGPLDMRFDQGGQGQTAADLVNRLSEKELAQMFFRFGEERRFGKKVARAIQEARKIKSLKSTTELFELIKKALPAKFRFRAGDTARRIFQSLRIAVNDELSALEKILPQALDLLQAGGRLVVISFHSLEDRIVKEFLVQRARDCICPPSFPICLCGHKAELRILTKKPVVATDEETKTNPRSRSAKLRAAEKIK